MGSFRRSRGMRLAAASAVMAVLAASAIGCSSQQSVTTAGPTQRYDAGALVIVPQIVHQTAVSLADAQFDLAHNETVGSDFKVQQTVFGLVTVDPAISSSQPGVPAPVAPQHRLAWVFFFAHQGVYNCPSQPGVVSSPTSTPGGSHRNALIVEAATGTALQYTGIGAAICTYNPRPILESAFQAVSVPWTELGGNRIRATCPGCVQPGAGTPTTSCPSGSVIEVLGGRTIGPCHSPATTSVLTINFPRPWKHGAVGPVRSGYADL